MLVLDVLFSALLVHEKIVLRVCVDSLGRERFLDPYYTVSRHKLTIMPTCARALFDSRHCCTVHCRVQGDQTVVSRGLLSAVAIGFGLQRHGF
jgi:hypothetical protein